MRACQFVGVAIVTSVSPSSVVDPPPDMTISPLQSIEVEFIVFMFVQDTKTA